MTLILAAAHDGRCRLDGVMLERVAKGVAANHFCRADDRN